MRFRPRRYAHRSLAAELAALLDEHVLADLRARVAAGRGPGGEDGLQEMGAIWILGGLFVRVLEDRGLLEPRCREAFTTEGELDSHAPGALVATMRAIGERLGSVWWDEGEMTPSTECLEVIGQVLYQTDERAELRWRFHHEDSRVWEDVYQHLGEPRGPRGGIGIVSTPEFVAAFLADRALEQASASFVLERVRVLDPACGSGNLLLAVFERLLEHQDGAGGDRLARALAVIDRISGVDISAPAVVIAQFRLLLAVVDAAGIERLADVPRLPLHVAAGDSLLDGEWLSTMLPGPASAADILRERYEIVLAEPPAVHCRDERLRARHRERYRSAVDRSALTGPFIELCLQTVVKGGVVVVLAQSSFARREFGKALVEDVLARVELRCVIDLSGAYVPGHGVPFLMLVVRNHLPATENVHVVLCRHGEQVMPETPVRGQVWTSIQQNWNRVGHDDEFIAVRMRPRSDFARHPWTLISDEAVRLWKEVEAQADRTLGDIASVHQGSMTGLDEVFLMPADAARRWSLEATVVRRVVSGASIDDWALRNEHDDDPRAALLPYAEDGSLLPMGDSQWGRYLWPYRCNLHARPFFSQTQTSVWWQWWRWNPGLASTSDCLFLPTVTRQPRFVHAKNVVPLKTALSVHVKPAAGVTPTFELLAYLNSSVANFCIMTRASTRAGRILIFPRDLARLPLPGALFESERPEPRRLAALGRALYETARQALHYEPDDVLASWDGSSRAALLQSLGTAEQRRRARLREMVYLQEEIDWLVYAMLGFTEEPEPEAKGIGRIWPDERPFAWLVDSAPERLPAVIAEPWQRRRRAAREHAVLAMLESHEYKRRWRSVSRARSVEDLDDRARRAYRRWLLACIEDMAAEDRAISSRTLVERLVERPAVITISALYGGHADMISIVSQLIIENAVPYLAEHRYTESGMVKRACWELCWARQRLRDAGKEPADLDGEDSELPPHYGPGDFLRPAYWHIRGKLDIPRERFIIYPEVENSADDTLVFSLASDNYPARSRALTDLYNRRKDELSPARLAFLLAGLVELLPWLEQWYTEEFDPAPLCRFVSQEAEVLGVTMDELRARAALYKVQAHGL